MKENENVYFSFRTPKEEEYMRTKMFGPIFQVRGAERSFAKDWLFKSFMLAAGAFLEAAPCENEKFRFTLPFSALVAVIYGCVVEVRPF